jgi:hypothetical protein
MITILTSTSNRTHPLARLYPSLWEHHTNDSLWVAVDDGSSVDEINS